MNKDLAKLAVDSWDDKKVLDVVVTELSSALATMSPRTDENAVSVAFNIGASATAMVHAVLLLRAYRDKKFGDKGVNTLD